MSSNFISSKICIFIISAFIPNFGKIRFENKKNVPEKKSIQGVSIKKVSLRIFRKGWVIFSKNVLNYKLDPISSIHVNKKNSILTQIAKKLQARQFFAIMLVRKSIWLNF